MGGRGVVSVLGIVGQEGVVAFPGGHRPARGQAWEAVSMEGVTS